MTRLQEWVHAATLVEVSTSSRAATGIGGGEFDRDAAHLAPPDRKFSDDRVFHLSTRMCQAHLRLVLGHCAVTSGIATVYLLS